MMPPPAQRAMAERAGASARETRGSHSLYVSQPQAVADLIHSAVESLTASRAQPCTLPTYHARSLRPRSDRAMAIFDRARERGEAKRPRLGER